MRFGKLSDKDSPPEPRGKVGDDVHSLADVFYEISEFSGEQGLRFHAQDVGPYERTAMMPEYFTHQVVWPGKGRDHFFV